MDGSIDPPTAVRSHARRHFFLVGAVAVVALMLFVSVTRLMLPTGSGAGHGGGAAGRATQVTQTLAETRPFADRIEALGVAKGVQSVNISSNATEIVSAVHFSDGAPVRRGALLVELRAREEAAGVEQARAALAVAQNNYDRYQRLAQAGFLSPSAMDQYQAAREQARADLAAAQSRQADRMIRAPFDGRLGIADLAPGTLINPGATIVTLDDVSTMRVEFNVPDRYLPALRVGATIAARPDPYPDEVARGSLALIDTRIDPTTHAIRARADFPNPDGRLVPGMLMHVVIENGQRQSVAVPESAVQAHGEQSFVYVIAHEGERTIARQTQVEVGVNQDGFVEIRNGLAAGTAVILDGLDRVSPNGPVRIAAPRGQQNGAAQRARGGDTQLRLNTQ